MVSIEPPGHHDHPAGDPGALAPGRLPAVLAVEIPLPWRSTASRCGPARATANIENAAVLRNCNPVSLTASGGQTPRMKMLEGSKDFRAQILRVVSQFSQRRVDPRKHARSRPMRLNVLGPFSHGVLSCSSDEA